MKRMLLGAMCALVVAAIICSHALAQTEPTVAVARPEAVTGATAPTDVDTREKISLASYYERDLSHYYGPADDAHTDDGTVIEAALAEAAGKTLVLEAGKTYTFGSYVRSNEGTDRWRVQGIRLTQSNVVIEGSGATLQWDPEQVFTGWEGLVLEGTKDQPIHDIVIRNLTFKAVNNSRDWVDPVSGKTVRCNNITQLLGKWCENVLVENCTFEAVPNPDESLHARSDAEGRGVNNLWFYGGCKNITVRGCTIKNVTCGSQESGGNLWLSGNTDFKQALSAEERTAYDQKTPDEQYQMLCERNLQGVVENVLITNNTFEHACHDESIALWCAQNFKDILITGNTFNLHDGDAHVPSSMNFTFGNHEQRDKLENVIFTKNNVSGEAMNCLLMARADMGGDLHVVDNDLRFKRMPRDRQRTLEGDAYVFSTKDDVASSDGLVSASRNRDYVDFSNNRVTYDNAEGGTGLLCLMGSRNLLCQDNTFTANGPLSFVAVIYANEAAGAAGHESVFVRNAFNVNGALAKSLVRGGIPFTGNTVQLNGPMTADALFNVSGHVDKSTNPAINVLYTLPADVDLSGNTVVANVALPQGLPALRVYDAAFAGHTLDFRNNTLTSTVDQQAGEWPLVRMQDLQGETPVVDATGSTSSLHDRVGFYRTAETDDGYADYGAPLVDPKVTYGDKTFAGTQAHWTTCLLADATDDPDAEPDPDPTSEPAAAVTATFADAKLYKALVAQLEAQGVAYEADESTRTVTLSAAEASGITELNLGYSELTNLEGIEALAGLSSLTRLQLDHNNLSGAAGAPLAALTQLTYLDLYENKLDDWSFLERLTNLEHLNLGLNRRGGDTRETLRKLKRLRWLDFSFAGPASESKTEANPSGDYNYIVQIVSKLPELEYLDLTQWYFNSLEGLERLTKLKVLAANNNYVRDTTPLLACTELEELYLAYNRMYWNNAADKGVGPLLADDGTLRLPKLKVLDVWGQESREGKPNLLDNPTSAARAHVDALYQLHKQRKLQLVCDYRRIGELAALAPHVDSAGVAYIAYDDFGTWCQEGFDDYGAMRNAHEYANDHGCEVRSTVGEGDEAAQGKTYHVYGHFDNKMYYAYTNVDWQGATFVIHHEDIDWHYNCGFQSLFYFRPSPVGFTGASRRPDANIRTFEAGATDEGKMLTVNVSKLPLRRTATSIRGLSPEVDAALDELAAKGYARFYVQLYDALTLRYRRGYVYHYNGEPQWDALIVNADGSVVRQNAAKLAGDETPAGSYDPGDPLPLQWEFDNITKVVIIPIAPTQAHIKNGRFVVNPLMSQTELPRERWGSVYGDILEIHGTNFELANITQTVGTAETGWDHNAYSGIYQGFIDLKDCAEMYMHDCHTWQRVCSRSTYGLTTIRMCACRIKNVGDSNPGHPYDYRGGHGNHGGNYGKHLLWENITLGRIDQHTGCYDLAVRDSYVHSLSLTGAGPLTVERTTVVGGNFINLRGDYGSTWDGVAHVIDCTHYPTLDAKQEPDSFAASTPEPTWDFGYPQAYPELHIKNFTIDCSKYTRGRGTRYRMAYGIAQANYLNGLNGMTDEGLKNYWPDTLEVDGVEIRNWSESLGYELHALMPLYMTAKPAAQMRSGAWTIKNLTYDGKPFTFANLESGDDLALAGQVPGDLVAGIKDVRDRKAIYGNLTNEQVELLEEKLPAGDIAVAYTGDEPRLLLRMRNVSDSNDSYIACYPYFVEHRSDMDVAYYSGREFAKARADRRAQYPDAGKWFALQLDVERFGATRGDYQDGQAHVLGVRLVKTHDTCAHVWGDATYTWSADHGSCTARRVCTRDATHVEEETVLASAQVTKPATCTRMGQTTYTATFTHEGFAAQEAVVEDVSVNPHAHDWGEGVRAVEPTCEEAGLMTHACKNDSSHTKRVVLPALGHDWGAWAHTMEPTEASEGEEARACQRCGKTETRAVPRTGHVHVPVAVAATEPTCTEAGVAAHWACTGGDFPCGRLFYDAAGEHEVEASELALAPLGHDWAPWAITTKPTEETAGVQTRVCQRCGETESEAVPFARYHVKELADSWVPGSGALSLSFERNEHGELTFAHFMGIEVDDSPVGRDCYDARPGSVVVTLHADYLATLAPGEHSLRARFDDGNDPAATFTVLAADDGPAPDDPGTADDPAGPSLVEGDDPKGAQEPEQPAEDERPAEAGGDKAGGDTDDTGDKAGGDKAGGDTDDTGDKGGGDKAGGDKAGGDKAGGDTGDKAGDTQGDPKPKRGSDDQAAQQAAHGDAARPTRGPTVPGTGDASPCPDSWALFLALAGAMLVLGHARRI